MNLQFGELMRRILLLIALTTPLFAQNAGVWGQRGASHRFVIRNGVLYAADGRGVSVYDVGDIHNLRRFDLETGDDETRDLAVMGNDLVVATSAGVERFAITENSQLDRLGSTTSTGATTRIAASAQFAAASNEKTLNILERNHETNGLSVVRKITYADPITAIAFVSDLLYVAVDREPLRVYAPPDSEPVKVLPGVNAAALALSEDNGVLWAASSADGLTAINVRTPENPKVIGSTGTNELHLAGVAASGTRVYAFESPDRIYVFDATEEDAPQLVATMTERVNVIAASGSKLFLAGNFVEASGLHFDPGLIPRETGKPLRAFDATNLSAPTLAGEFEDLAGPVSGAWTDGSVAYIVDPPYLRVLDVSKTSEPREVSRMTVPNLQDKIRVKNGLAVLYGRAYVNLLDVTTPLRPKYLGTWNAQGHPPSAAAILESRVIEANEHSGMHVVDVDDPAHAVQIGGRKWHYRDMAAGDDAAYALQHDLMLVVQIENDQKVVDQDEIFIQYEQVDIAPPNSGRPDYLVVRGDDGLRVYSLADRFHPHELDFLTVTGLGLFATGNTSAYITKDGRLHFVDLTASKLTMTPTEMRVTAPMQISVAGEKIVVADRYSVRIYGPDTASPPPPPARRRMTRH